MLKMLNVKLECHMARPHALPHEVSTFIYTRTHKCASNF